MTTKKGAKVSKSKKPAVKKQKASAKRNIAKKKSTKPRSITPKPEEAVESLAFRNAKKMSEEYARDPEKAKRLLDETTRLAGRIKEGSLGEAWKYLTAIRRLTSTYITRRYTKVPVKTIAVAMAGLIYFVNPFDLLTDFLPVVGYLDDGTVLSLVAASIKGDLDNFLAWEREQQSN